MSALLELEGLAVRRGRRDILAGVTLSVAAGEMLGLVGPNGAGKTTLIRAALGLQKRAAGAVRLAARPLESLGERERAAIAGYLPQERRVAWNMPARDVAALGAAGLAPNEGHAVALACLTELEVEGLAGRGVLDMSGGERARVLLARLLATKARLLVADEPAAGLDPEAQLLILERLRARADAGAAVVVTSHDLALAARFCDRLAVLHHGRLRIVAEPHAALSREILAEVFALDGELTQSPAGPILAARRLPGVSAGR
jgi:iron complex transport system ATP-binding protein